MVCVGVFMCVSVYSMCVCIQDWVWTTVLVLFNLEPYLQIQSYSRPFEEDTVRLDHVAGNISHISAMREACHVPESDDFALLCPFYSLY